MEQRQIPVYSLQLHCLQSVIFWSLSICEYCIGLYPYNIIKLVAYYSKYSLYIIEVSVLKRFFEIWILGNSIPIKLYQKQPIVNRFEMQ